MTGSLVGEALLVFAVIFLFEIVDRTNFAMISLAGKHPPAQVWSGAAAAFVVSSAISVGIGAAVVNLLPTYLMWVKVVGGGILVAFGLREVLKQDGGEEAEAERRIEKGLSATQVRLTAFALILFLEMGDNTQILTILFVAAAPPGAAMLLTIFVAATVALWCTSAVGASGGHYLKTRVPAEKLEKVLGAILVAVGGVTIVLALEPNLVPPIF